MKYKLTFDFDNLEELKTFVSDCDLIENIKLKKTFKKSDDKRGSSTGILHQKAKEYQEEHKETPYKEILKIVGAQIKNKNKIQDININI